MPTAARFSIVAFVAACGLSLLVALFWIAQLATLSDLHGSDAAGNGFAQAVGAGEILVAWILLAILAAIAFLGGARARPAIMAACILIPTSGVAAMKTLQLLIDPSGPPYFWPLIIPGFVPPLIVGFCFWSLLPSWRAAIPARYATGVAWGAVFILCLSIWPLGFARQTADEQEQAARAQYAADFAKLSADAPLWDWTPFLATQDDTRLPAALDGIRHLDRRQGDAETMLDRGDFPLRFLGSFDLDPTPSLCEKTRALLRRRVAPLVVKDAGTRPYADIATQVSDALAAMTWLVGYNCPLDAEATAWESMAKAYSNPNYDVIALPELRDPKELGRILRENPARFSMLTPQAHLKAWLGFADKPELRDQALAGARGLDHRTADAIEMLNSDEFSAARLLQYLPVLNLETTPALCDAAQRVVLERFAGIYRPSAEEHVPYGEMLERMGTSDPLSALIWLASHGCDAARGSEDAESLVGAYDDSPERTAMLATLAGLRRKQ